jgi:hypothetical protein
MGYTSVRKLVKVGLLPTALSELPAKHFLSLMALSVLALNSDCLLAQLPAILVLFVSSIVLDPLLVLLSVLKLVLISLIPALPLKYADLLSQL